MLLCVFLPVLGDTELLLLGRPAQTLVPHDVSCTYALPIPIFLLPSLSTAVQKFLGESDYLARGLT